MGDLTLLDSAETGTVAEGETTTVAGHEVSINWMDSDEVKFVVDGVLEDAKLTAGSSRKLSDGSYLGVRDVSKLEVSGEIGTTSFSIGSGKLKIVSGSEIELNDVSVDGVYGYVYNDSTGGSTTVQKVDKITIEWKADEEMFLTADSELVMPGFGGLKFTMNDLVRPTEEKVTVAKDTDSSIEVTMPIKDGDVSFNLLYANATGDFEGIGKASDDRLATSNNNSLVYFEKHSGTDYHKMFIASYNTTTQAESYLLKASIAYDSTNGRDEVKISKKTPSGWVIVCEDKTNADDCSIGDVTLTVVNVSDEPLGNESVTLSAGSKVSFHTIFTRGGLMMYLPFEQDSGTYPIPTGGINVSGDTVIIAGGGKSISEDNVWNNSDGFNTYSLYFDAEDKDDTIASGNAFNFTIDDNSDNALEVTKLGGTGTGGTHGLEQGTDTAIYEAHIGGDVDPFVLHYTKPDEDWVEVYYATGNSETYAEVYVAEESASITSITTASGSASLGEVLVKDSEVSSVSSKNLIVVGGSCINSAAATLIGGAKCTTDFTTATGIGSGQFLIQSFGNAYTTGKIALLVAGYAAADTVNAVTYLRTKTVDTTAGRKYKGTSSTSASLVVT